LGEPVELEADEPMVGLPVGSLLEERVLELLLLVVVVVVTAAAVAAAVARAPARLLSLATSHGELVVLRLHGMLIVCHWRRREGWAHSSPTPRPALLGCVYV